MDRTNRRNRFSHSYIWVMLFLLLIPVNPVRGQAPGPFRALIAKETAAGLTLEASQEVATAGGRYLAATFRFPEKHEGLPGGQGLRIYYLAAGSAAPVERARYDEQQIYFGTYDAEERIFADVNGDATTDLVVSAGNGGNCWNCSRVLLYSLEAREARLLAAAPMRLEDVLGDVSLELLVGDTRWEFYDDFSHAGSPGGTLVYTWRDGAYVFAGRDAADFYRKEAAPLRAELPEAIAAISADVLYSDEQYLHAALSLYLIAAYTEQLDKGAEELRKMLSEHAASAEMRERRKRILDDFLSGESADMLREPRRGEPLSIDSSR